MIIYKLSNSKHSVSFPKKLLCILQYATCLRFLFAILLPIVTLILTGHNLSQYNHNSGWSYAFIHPNFTLRQLREGHFFIDYYKSVNTTQGVGIGSFQGLQNAYTGVKGFFLLPPLVLVLFQPIFTLSNSLNQNLLDACSKSDFGKVRIHTRSLFCIQEILFGSIFVLIDFIIAYLLMSLSQRLSNLRLDCDISHAQHDGNDNVRFTSRLKQFESYEKEMESHMQYHIRPENGYLFGMPTLANKSSCNENLTKSKNISTDIYSKETNQDEKNKPDETYSFKSNESHFILSSRISQYIFFLYFCNPIIIASSMYFHSWQGLLHLLYIASLHQAYNGNAPLATIFLAIWNYFDTLNPMLHVVSIILLVRRKHSIPKSVIGSIGFFCLWSFFLFYTSMILIRDDRKEKYSWNELYRSHIHNLGYDDLCPSLGMLWYFYIQLFFRFKDFFVVLLKGIPCLFLVPLSLRLWRYPLELSLSLLFITKLLGASLNLQNTVFVLISLLLSPQTIARMDLQRVFVALFAMMVPVSLFIMDSWLWLNTGSGNANYLYFQCLAFTILLGSILLEFVFAGVKRDKALRLIETARKFLNEEKQAVSSDH